MTGPAPFIWPAVDLAHRRTAGHALHLWRGGHPVSHFAGAVDDPALAKFDARMQGLVAHLRDERAR